MNIIKDLICHFKGHVIDSSESILADTMLDCRNWLCRCHRCGVYLMHDGAISGGTITVSKRTAYKIKAEFEEQFAQIVKELEDENNQCDAG